MNAKRAKQNQCKGLPGREERADSNTINRSLLDSPVTEDDGSRFEKRQAFARAVPHRLHRESAKEVGRNDEDVWKHEWIRVYKIQEQESK